jgi:uncharacterized membrane protein YecN with MAPEG domain
MALTGLNTALILAKRRRASLAAIPPSARADRNCKTTPSIMPTLTLPAAPITAATASALSVLYIRLAFKVIALRRKHGVRLGTGLQDDLEAAVRAHANFAEYVPITLLMLALAEVNHRFWPLTSLSAALLVFGRVTHAQALPRGSIPLRVRGMKATFFAIAVAALANLSAFVTF